MEPWAANRLTPGPMLDLLGMLCEAGRGGDAITVGDVTYRLGIPHSVAVTRLEAFVDQGYAIARLYGGQPFYRATKLAYKTLDGGVGSGE